MFIVVIIHLLLVIALLIKESALFNKWIKMLISLYYTLITIIFITGHRRIHIKYNMDEGPVIQEGWEVSSNWAFTFSFAFILPLAILTVYIIVRKVKPAKNNRWMPFILGLLLSGIILFILFMIFNIAYGMRP